MSDQHELEERETAISRAQVVEKAALSPTFDDAVLARHPECP
jgi:hypothetical protein